MAFVDEYGNRIQAPKKRKKRKPLRGGASSPGYADIGKQPKAPVRAPQAPQTPRFPSFAPQQNAPRSPDEATYGINLKNLSQAYFEKYDTFPNAMQTYFMLENAGGALWSKGEWSTLLAPGKALPSPLFNEFERVLRGKDGLGVSAKKLNIGVPAAKQEKQQLYREQRSTAGQTSSEAAFSINEADPKMLGRDVDTPDFANIPIELAELHNKALVEVGGMDPTQLAAYSPDGMNMVAWKRYWAGVKESRGEKYSWDPESPEWSKGLDKEYRRYLWYKVLPYAMLSKDQPVKQSALKALDAILPGILGSYSLDPLGKTDLKFKTALANVTDIVGALPDSEARKEYYFTSFAAGRMPGDSDRKVLYDYVAEFGQNNLPADKIAEYRESLLTLNKIVAWPFEKATEGAKDMLEKTDFLFDKLKQQPGTWGTVGDALHTAWNKGIIELNPFTSSLIPMGIGYGHQAGGAILSLFQDSMLDMPRPEIMGPDTPERQKRIAEGDADISTWGQLVAAHEWVERWDAHAGKDAFVDLADDYLNDQGVPQDDWTRDAFRDVATVASLYITLKIAGKSDMFIRKAVIYEARKGFGALRFGEDVLRRRDPRSQEGFIDIGPAGTPKKGTFESRTAALDVFVKNGEFYDRFIADAVNDARTMLEKGRTDEAEHWLTQAEGRAESLQGTKLAPSSGPDLMDAPERMFDANEQIGVGQQAGLDIAIDTTATKTEPFAAPPKKAPEQMPGQTGMDVPEPAPRDIESLTPDELHMPIGKASKAVFGNEKVNGGHAGPATADMPRYDGFTLEGPETARSFTFYDLPEGTKMPYKTSEVNAFLKAHPPDEITIGGLYIGGPGKVRWTKKEGVVPVDRPTARPETSRAEIHDIQRKQAENYAEKTQADLENHGLEVVDGKVVDPEVGNFFPGEKTLGTTKEARSGAAALNDLAGRNRLGEIEQMQKRYDRAQERLAETAAPLEADNVVPIGKPHEGRLTEAPDEDFPDEWLTAEEIAARDAVEPIAVEPTTRREMLEGEAAEIRASLEADADLWMERGADADIREGLNADLPGSSDADLIDHIKSVAKDHGGLSRDPSFWDSDATLEENNAAFLGLARAGHHKRLAKGVDPISLDEIARDLDMQGIHVDASDLWDVMQREAERRASGPTGTKKMTPAQVKAATKRLQSIEQELAWIDERGAPPRTPTPATERPSPAGAGRAAEGTAATPPSPSAQGPSRVPDDYGPPRRTGAAPVTLNQYQTGLNTPDSVLGIHKRAPGETLDLSPEIAEQKRLLDAAGREPDSGPPERTGMAPTGQRQTDIYPKVDPLGIPMTPKDGGPLGQQNFDTKGAGEAPPKAEPPTTSSVGVPPSDPMYWHIKALMTVTEYVAKYANENSASLIRRMLNLEDEALLTPEAKAGVKEAVIAMQKTHDPDVVLNILEDLERKGVDTIDALGPAFFRAGKARTFENAFAAADKLGPLGRPLLESVRLMGTPSHLNRQIPFRDADYHVRNLGISFKMGKKRMTAEDLDTLRDFEQRMFEADTRLERDNVLHKFEATVVENMKKDGLWDGPKGYLAFQKSILDRRAAWVGYHLGSPKREAYGSESTVPPMYRQMKAEINSYREKERSYADAGDEVNAAIWKKLADEGENRLDEMQGAGHIYTDEAKHPGKYRRKNEKGEDVEGNGPDGYAMNDEYNKAMQFLHDMGDEQPVWTWQLKQKLTMDSVDPRFLAWFQSGRSWQTFMKWDVKYAEPFIRQWKQWTLAGAGFPIRVFAGDEFWRLPMEGINPFARGSRAEVARMRGDLKRGEQKRMDELGAKDRAGTLSEKEKAELSGLKEKARPKVNEDILDLISKAGAKLDADVLNIGSDYWQLLGPVNRGTDPSGKVIWEVPDDPRYLKRVQRDIGLFSEEPVIRMLMAGKNWTHESAAQAIRVLLISDTEAGAATRALLQQTGRITAPQLDIQTLQRTLMRKSSGSPRNIDNIINEWVGMYMRIDSSPEMRQGIRNGHIPMEDLKRVAENNPGALPTVPVGAFDRAVKGGAPAWLNLGPFIYDRVTLPMMTAIGGRIRDTLFGHEYLRQMEILRKKMPDADEQLLMDQAAGRAANFVEKTTYTRDATVFEDMVRNHILFINSYRQFWQYWLTKMVTRPVTMGTLWTMAPQKDDPGVMGAFARHFSSYMPFFLQNRGSDERRTPTPMAEIGAIATPPGFGPLESVWLGWAIRNELGTDPGLLPGQASMGGSLLPGNRMGLITEGLFNVNLPFISKDDVTSHAMLTAYEKETVDVGDYVGGVGDKPLQSNLPQPLAATVWIRDMVNKHGFEWMKDRVFGNPIAFQQLLASLTGAPTSLFVQNPPIYTDYAKEQIKYSDLLMAGKPIDAAAFKQSTKYAKFVDEMKATTNVKDKIQMLQDYPWLPALHNSVYTYDSNGQLIYDDTWVREVKPEAEAQNDLREVLRNMYGGYKFDPATGNYLDTDDASYPGDIARRVEMPVVKKHLKDIDELARAAATDYATVNGVLLKKLYDDCMSDWRTRTDTYAAVDKWVKEPDAPDWYTDYVKAHKKELSKDLPDGYTVHAWWHPKVYKEKVAGLWKKDYQSGNWKPNESEARTIKQMAEAGVFDDKTRDLYLGKDTPTGGVISKVDKEAIAYWRSHIIDVNTAAFYDLDQTTLNRIGFHFGPEINDAIKKVRRAYYVFTSIVGTKAADGDTITYSSREYRDGRLKFNAYKDKVFGAVKGGEAFVGGAAERLMHTPFLTGPGTLKFTGDDAVDDAKLWKQYLKEAGKRKPDLKVLRTLSDHFDSHFADKIAAYNAANHWVAVTGTALTMRWIMKESYSEYYQGPGNSMYSNYGEAMVKKLEKLIGYYSKTNPSFRRDIETYGWDDEHDVANDLLEWYYH